MKKTVESNWNQISDDEWEVIDRDSVIKKFSDWIYSQVDVDKIRKSNQPRKKGNTSSELMMLFSPIQTILIKWIFY